LYSIVIINRIQFDQTCNWSRINEIQQMNASSPSFTTFEDGIFSVLKRHMVTMITIVY